MDTSTPGPERYGLKHMAPSTPNQIVKPIIDLFFSFAIFLLAQKEAPPPRPHQRDLERLLVSPSLI